MAVLDAVAESEAAAERWPSSSPPPASPGRPPHRLAVALEAHGILRRDGDGRFALGPRLLGLGRAAAARWPVVETRPVRCSSGCGTTTGESVQLYVRDGTARVCVESLDSPNELRTIVDVGARLPLDVGSAGRVLAATGAGRAPVGRERRGAGAGCRVGQRPVPGPGGSDAGRDRHLRPDRAHDPPARAEVRRRGGRSRRSDRAGGRPEGQLTSRPGDRLRPAGGRSPRRRRRGTAGRNRSGSVAHDVVRPVDLVDRRPGDRRGQARAGGRARRSGPRSVITHGRRHVDLADPRRRPEAAERRHGRTGARPGRPAASSCSHPRRRTGRRRPGASPCASHDPVAQVRGTRRGQRRQPSIAPVPQCLTPDRPGSRGPWRTGRGRPPGRGGGATASWAIGPPIE